ncbi:hypothetical protein [Haloechinothrix salitolerans]|uniref:Stress response protein n=1 Tax=Haloechinothrix salitolerans TaxID=926830 RepID=A0ABW2BTX0_9PSEU
MLAALTSVPPFAKAMLQHIGQRLGVRASLECFTEVVFDGNSDKIRPDGLIVVDGGRGRQWHCLVEAKIGRTEIDADQLTKYLNLARSNNVPALLTISNQFVATPRHSPVRLPKSATKGVETFHWSWMSVVTEAMLLLNEYDFERPEQRFILNEMVRYFSHRSVAVTTFDRMNPEWKELNSKVQSGARLAKTAPEVEDSVAAWHQETRDLCLLLSRKLSHTVRLRLSRAHREDPTARMRDDCESLVATHRLSCTFDIPDAAAPLVVVADLQRRCISVSMTLAAPRDKQRASSRINWLLRQLTKTDPHGIHVRAYWPGRAPTTQASLADLRDNASVLESENRSLVPTSFEVLLVQDLAGKFSGSRTFIELLEGAVPTFYERVGERLRPYITPPPKLQRQQAESADDAGAPDGHHDEAVGNRVAPLPETTPMTTEQPDSS